ncbi:CLUMA_CG020320, isoform A [Clunio marinus]|uniref:CLUMA_CG020320, isoform A n=1 Tax=Clunio marinus TaxID=568069 RepID=A0A1J1J4K4_9DIPT|nr:CLUMA_CG020320, isoform A [Clunio marinus]
MRKVSVLIFAFIALCSARYMTDEVKYADDDFIVKQQEILEILMHVWQEEIHNKYYDVAKQWNFDSYKDKFTPEVYDNFTYYYDDGFLDMTEIFAPFQTDQNGQMLALFKMFYYAKDWDTFYRFMCWARFNINPGMFIQSLSMAVLHRDDLAGIVLPAIYEISPFYFFNNYVVTNARLMTMRGTTNMMKNGDTNSYTFEQNYTNYYVETNHDSKLAYFMEDIGLNAYYYYWNLDYNAFLGGDEFGLKNDRRGEFYIYQIRQILARYYLERLSNGLGEIPEINFWTPLETGYYPSLAYYNGVNFPTRSNYYMMYLNKDNQRYLEHLYNFEHRLFEAIDSGYILKPDGEKLPLDKPETVEELGNLIQMNKDSFGNMYYYGMLEILGRRLLGASVHSFDSYRQIPSVLELFETAMRDPMFYVFYKRISFFYDAFAKKFPKYTKTELGFDGVAIEGIEMNKLLTYFDNFTADISNAADIPTDTKDIANARVELKVQVPRLNHLPFTVKMKVKSDKDQKAVMVIFVGPKYDSYGNILNINENRNNFWELDRYLFDLKTGENVYERKSTDFTWFVNDRTTYSNLYKSVMSAKNGGEKFPLDMSEAHCGFPARLMLPRGRVGGFAVQFFFMVMPYKAPTYERFSGYDASISCGVGSGTRYLDSVPFGFPFNREIDIYDYRTPNIYFYDTAIYQKTGNPNAPYF